jgi:hypothetical protein
MIRASGADDVALALTPAKVQKTTISDDRRQTNYKPDGTPENPLRSAD